MKTVTEFFGPSFAKAYETEKELNQAGKTVEELPAAREEAIKTAYGYADEKLKHFINALDAIQASRQKGSVKRVVVMTFAETEKAPSNVLARDGFHYVVEFFPSANKPAQNQNDSRERGRGGRDGKGRRGRDGKGGRGQRDFGGRGPRPAQDGDVVISAEGAPAPGSAEEGRSRRPRNPRRRRPMGDGTPATARPPIKPATPLGAAAPAKVVVESAAAAPAPAEATSAS